MAYTALYRKLRPDTFADIVGQEHITNTLKNQVTSNRVSHAYLFCGSRGTGKTTTAKVLAKVLNCEAADTGEPCGKCRSCLEIESGSSVNVIEVDAAGNSRVEEMRELLQDVAFLPLVGRFKVYIMDEVHMLTINAFNALLKTLEEPPPHVVFILATTDPQKVIPTIQSRCQRYDFRRIPAPVIANQLRVYAKEEHINTDDGALAYIAHLADGAMRDAVNLLDQCVSLFADKTITADDVRNITGAVDDTVLFELTDALYTKNTVRCIDIINDAIDHGRDVARLVSELVTHFRNVIIAITAPNADNTLQFSKENRNRITNAAKRYDLAALLRLINEFSKLQSNLKRQTSGDRILLDVCCISACQDEQPAAQPTVVAAAPPVQSPTPPKQPAPTKQKAVPDTYRNIITNWSSVCDSVTDSAIKGFLHLSKPGYMDTEMLYVRCPDISTLGILKQRIKDIEYAIEQKFGATVTINVVLEQNYNQTHKKRMGVPDDDDYSFSKTVEQIKDMFENVDITVE